MEERRAGYDGIREEMTAEFSNIRKDIEDVRKSIGSTMKWVIGLIVIPICAGLIAWGSLTTRVDNMKETLDVKANRETVDSQFAAVNQSLGRIEAVLSKMQNK